MSYTLCEICDQAKPAKEVRRISDDFERVCHGCEHSMAGKLAINATNFAKELVDQWKKSEREKAKEQSNA